MWSLRQARTRLREGYDSTSGEEANPPRSLTSRDRTAAAGNLAGLVNLVRLSPAHLTLMVAYLKHKPVAQQVAVDCDEEKNKPLCGEMGIKGASCRTTWRPGLFRSAYAMHCDCAGFPTLKVC